MKKITFSLITLMTIIMVACTAESNSDALTENGKFISASVTRAGDNARAIAWDLNAAEEVEFTAETAGEKATITVTLTGKTEEKVNGEVQPLVLKLTSLNNEEEMTHEFTATDESMKALKDVVAKGEAGEAVELNFKGEVKAADVAKINNSKYFVNVVMP